MNGYLLRDDAPFGADTWAKIDDMVATVVRKNLTARKFTPMVGPLGWGVEVAPLVGFEETEGGHIASETETYLRLQQLEAGFRLRLKHLAMADQTPFSLDVGAAASAAVEIARQEDDLLLGGMIEAGKSAELGDWDTLNGPFTAIVKAEAELRSTGFDGPFALALSHALYARLASLMQHGRRELEMVQRLVEVGIFRSRAVPEDQALLVSPQAWNFDMVVGQDIATAFVGNEGLELGFRVIETVALRVKRPGSILVLS